MFEEKSEKNGRFSTQIREEPKNIGGEGVQASEPPAIVDVYPRINLAENAASAATLWVRR